MPAFSSDSSIVARYFPALGRRNFRLFWFGQIVSLTGTWMQNIGQDWLVLQLTGSAAKLAAVSAMQFLPMMLFSVFAGPFIDRFPKRRTIIVTQSILAVLALVLALIVWFHVAQYWMILVLAFLLGMVTLVDNPTRQAFVIELAGRDVLMNAVSLNSAAFNSARMFGPAVAGLLIELLGIAPCFFLNALSFLAVIGALLKVDTPNRVGASPVGSLKEVIASVGEGIAHVRSRPAILRPLLLMGVLSTFVINYNVFVPTFAKINLGQNASGYGFLMTALGIGSLIAAISQAARSKSGPSQFRIWLGAAGMSGAILLVGLQRSYPLTALLLAFAGFFTITLSTSMNTSIQLAAADDYRGRVMSLWSWVLGGVSPIGSLWAGSVSELSSPAVSMAVSGGIGLVFTAVMFFLTKRKGRGAGPGMKGAEGA
ncbi:MAG TPA: MFS transporter [Rectinemataceae bacterium]|nr:MFS transporter [Rectinemataceae bacterium]